MIKRLIEKLKTLRLYFVMFSYKNKDEYVQYGMCPVFIVWKNDGVCIMGHMFIKKTDTKDIISKKLTELVKKMCKENNLSDEQMIKHIDDNLKRNGLL
jgi:hypothetical protein